MAKRIYSILIAIFIASCSFFVAKYLINYAVLQGRDVTVNLSIDEATAGTIAYRFDKLSADIDWGKDTLILNEQSSNIQFFIPYDVEAKRLFLSAKDSVSFNIKSLEIRNTPLEIKYSYSELVGQLFRGYFNLKSPEPISLTNNYFRIELRGTSQSLEFQEDLLHDIYYNHFYRVINLGAFSVFVLVFFLALLFLNRSNKIKLNYNTVFFLSFILFLVVGFFSPRQNTTNENRTLLRFPSFKVNIWKIPQKYTAHFNDHFPYRSEISAANSRLKIKYLDISPNPETVRIGKDGWLFFSEKNVREVSRGEVIYTDNELVNIRKNLEKHEKNINGLGAEFYVFIPPLKHSIYKEKLPISMQRGVMNKHVQLMKYLKDYSNLNVIDVYPALMAKKDSVDLYYQTDTHWNQLGAFYAYQEFINEIHKKFPSVGKPKTENDYTIDINEEYTGDLLQMINIYDVFTRKVLIMNPTFTKKASERRIEIPQFTESKYSSFESPLLAEKPRLLMYRDSYSEYLFKHISEHFSYYGLSWTQKISVGKIKEVKPDIVVFETMERFINKLADEELLVDDL